MSRRRPAYTELAVKSASRAPSGDRLEGLCLRVSANKLYSVLFYSSEKGLRTVLQGARIVFIGPKFWSAWLTRGSPIVFSPSFLVYWGLILIHTLA